MAIKVSQATIDAIKSKGMGASLKAASAGGASDEFKEGVKRMYGANRMGAQNEKTMNEADTAATKSVEKKPVPMPASAPAAATRVVSGPKKIDTGQTFGIGKKLGNWFTKGDKKAATEEKARQASRPAPKPKPAPTADQASKKRIGQLTSNNSSYDPQSASAKRKSQYESDIQELKKLTGK